MLGDAYLKRLPQIDKMKVYSDMDKYSGNWESRDRSVVALIRIKFYLCIPVSDRVFIKCGGYRLWASRKEDKL